MENLSSKLPEVVTDQPATARELTDIIDVLRKRLDALAVITVAKKQNSQAIIAVTERLQSLKDTMHSILAHYLGIEASVITDETFETITALTSTSAIRPNTPSSDAYLKTLRQTRRSADGSALSEFALFVLFQRKRAGLNQDQFGQLMGSDKYSKQYISKVESGRIKKPSHDFLINLSEFLKIPIDELLAMTTRYPQE